MMANFPSRHAELVSASRLTFHPEAPVDRQPCAYILADKPRGRLYVGVTSDLIARLHQHRSGSVPGFTARYGVKRLVHYERAETMEAAILREKQLKRRHRDWKLNLIEQHNPHWADLAVGLGLAPLAR
jgi:putative endonuclease